MDSLEQPLGTYDASLNAAAYRLVGKGQECLDVGCWTGNMGRALVREKQCVVDGIDVHTGALEEAAKNGYRKLFQLDLNDGTVDFRAVKGSYDTVLCCDIFEHLLQPQKRLRDISPLLKPDGRVIVSLPNIGFVLYRLKHLLGQWNYEDKGIMDRTHIVFFTKKSAETMFREAGYEIISSEAYNEVSPKFFFLKFLGRLRPSLFAVQLVFVLSPVSVED
ncbi:MAG TPA: methyltransferase domain-containing protein [Candidatus Limnocylindrales bacterium]|nr:methyltransferase domain-containing protein [Candidatus Limnocylindrales bacterium]